MEPEASNNQLRNRFTEALNNAITLGASCARMRELGPRTRAAIDSVAMEHPDATADEIASAYDAFRAEHDPRARIQPRRRSR